MCVFVCAGNVVSMWDTSGSPKKGAWHMATFEGNMIILCWNRETSTIVWIGLSIFLHTFIVVCKTVLVVLAGNVTKLEVESRKPKGKCGGSGYDEEERRSHNGLAKMTIRSYCPKLEQRHLLQLKFDKRQSSKVKAINIEYFQTIVWGDAMRAIWVWVNEYKFIGQIVWVGVWKIIEVEVELCYQLG